MILVTGATGFIGAAVVRRLVADRESVRVATRSTPVGLPAGVERVAVPDISGATEWHEALVGVRTVVHSAARVHVMRDQATDPLAEFRRVNVVGTVHLAREAASAGVRRFVFISSIKVNGEGTVAGRPYRPDDKPAPVDPYGISKYEAEEALHAISRESGLEVVIIRPVLVYGPGVKGNFASMLRWVSRGIPLPLGAIQNRRSLVALDNLVDLIATCVRHPAAANETFLVSDGEDMSTPELFRRVGTAVGRPARLIPVPPVLLTLGARMLGRQGLANRVLGSLQVDIDKTRQRLGWSPVFSVDEALRRTAAGPTPMKRGAASN